MSPSLRTLIAVLALVVLVPGVAPAGPKPKRELVVMTRNLYLGASLDSAVEADTPLEFLMAVATIYGTVQFTDFPARAEALADEIAATGPDLIGLQEVSSWISVGPGAPPSLDFLAILQQALADRDLSYSVAAVSNNANIGPVPLLLCSVVEPPSCSLTFQDRDVILVNDDTRGLRVFNPRSDLYDAQLMVDTPVGPLSFSRGWCSIDGRLQGKRFRFVNTHLETAAAPEVQEAQAREFLRGPARARGAVIGVGDFNSAADGSTTRSYAILTKSFFRDAWETRANDPGDTCCQNETLTNPVSLLAERIDLVLTHAAVRALDAEVVGDEPFQATPPLWSSDHAGVVAVLRVH